MKNYGPGLKWLPGVVVELEGSVLVQVCLADGRMVRCHVDQLHPRVGEMGDSPENGSSQHQRSEEGDNAEPETLTSDSTPSTKPPPASTQNDQQVSESANAEGLSPDITLRVSLRNL